MSGPSPVRRRSLHRTLAALALAVLTAGVAAAPAPAAAAALPPGARYALVHGCYALQAADGRYVAKAAGNGYAATATTVAAAEPLRMQATRLGSYLLYGRAGDFLSTTANAVVTAADGGPDGDFVVDTTPDRAAFTLVTQAGRALTTDAAGRLVLTAAGSAGRFTFAPADGCATFPEAELDATGKPGTGKTPYSETRGLIDAHMHMMAYEFLGGDIHCGKPWDPYGVTHALPTCSRNNLVNQQGEIVVDNFLAGETNPAQPQDPVGWPTFRDWPAHESLTHEQSYYRWLERAWMGGLRVFVNLFVENHALCSLYPVKHNSCNEMTSVRLQAKRLRQLEDYIDAQEGGPGKGWFRIVKDPFQARRVINAGKLAVVPGIEVSNLFDCGLKDGSPTCDKAQVDAGLAEAYDKLGVRDMELINKFNNGFGGVAGDSGTTGVIVNAGNKLETGQFWDLETCTGEPEEADRTQYTLPGTSRDQLLGSALAILAPNSALPLYPPAPHCNKLGLSTLGDHLVRGMMKRGMIVDPDHLDVIARKALLSLTESQGYSGVISSHSWSTADAYPRIYASGGIVTPYAGNTQSFCKAYRQIAPKRDPRYLFGFGWGADMNGFGGQGGPRNGPDPVTYPFKSFDGRVTFTRERTGERTFDINTDGVAHYGLYPDWVEDLRHVCGQRIVDDMAKGPEAYLQMWERADGIAPEYRERREARLRFGRAGLGLTKLAVAPEELLRGGGQPASRKGRVWSYRVKGRGNAKARVRAVFTPGERVGLVISDASRHRVAGVGRGSAASRLAGTATRFGSTMLIRRAGAGRSYLFGVRGGRVRWAAVATAAVTRDPATARRYVALAGLR
ncbi:Coagulation factor 5/8 type domain-containing protein [Paraconexibacter antarcticus]|uniref:Coagulation factor 5/8 type domain-containing protein n=1 Tax=Paraconexibacter antarcticus TaxID=2949664 RepID=A0ABY5DM03_9ACTN|nr:Coagulation factor 5/8 type domain-containing protein [Paraconexibacter antarcticus]UTI62561.1 Coagulation factor 5/8 type domain-containing protein [Paraconexibacter antarcticus]